MNEFEIAFDQSAGFRLYEDDAFDFNAMSLITYYFSKGCEAERHSWLDIEFLPKELVGTSNGNCDLIDIFSGCRAKWGSQFLTWLLIAPEAIRERKAPPSPWKLNWSPSRVCCKEAFQYLLRSYPYLFRFDNIYNLAESFGGKLFGEKVRDRVRRLWRIILTGNMAGKRSDAIASECVKYAKKNWGVNGKLLEGDFIYEGPWPLQSGFLTHRELKGKAYGAFADARLPFFSLTPGSGNLLMWEYFCAGWSHPDDHTLSPDFSDYYKYVIPSVVYPSMYEIQNTYGKHASPASIDLPPKRPCDPCYSDLTNLDQ